MKPPFEYLHLENARRVYHQFGVIHELKRDENTNIARAMITNDIRHYHKKATETYHFVSGVGRMELNNQIVDVKPGTTIEIMPGTRHRAWTENGILDIIVISSPPYDPSDEFRD